MNEARIQESPKSDLYWWEPLNQQRLFRDLLNAFSYPGTLHTAAEGEGLTALLATLVDGEVSLADPDQLLGDLLMTRLDTRVVRAEQADFIVARGDQDPAWVPRMGNLASPEQGATVLIRVQSLTSGDPWELTGPGIAQSQSVTVSGLAPAWLQARQQWCANYPQGVDWVLTDDHHYLALPRTTRIQRKGESSWVM